MMTNPLLSLLAARDFGIVEDDFIGTVINPLLSIVTGAKNGIVEDDFIGTVINPR